MKLLNLDPMTVLMLVVALGVVLTMTTQASISPKSSAKHLVKASVTDVASVTPASGTFSGRIRSR